MSRRARFAAKTVEHLDVQIMNTKVHLHRKLVSSYIDYDHYRAGAVPQNHVILSEPWISLNAAFSDISPCDFADFHSNLLIKYTLGRFNTDPQVPQYYKPRAKEERMFRYHVSTVLPVQIRTFKDQPEKSPEERCFEKEFRLDYARVMTRKYRK
ncbi:hypothetical protein OXX79_012757 [Metschnikowia pulcherrima]